jgi:hypothetical protein
VMTLATLAHCAEQIDIDASSWQSVARYEEILAAPVTSPDAARQVTHAGALAERVGHRHWALEQADAAMTTFPH